MSDFGQDDNGLFRRLSDGRVLRVKQQMFNAILTLSKSQESPTWDDGW